VLIAQNGAFLDLLLQHPFNGLFPGQPGKPAPERQTILDFTGARDNRMAVASAGPYASHLHLAADRQPRQYL